MSRARPLPETPDRWTRDGVLILDLGWSSSRGAYRNQRLHKVAAIAQGRCQPLFKTWAATAPIYGSDLGDLLASCYLEGFTDGQRANEMLAGERPNAQ